MTNRASFSKVFPWRVFFRTILFQLALLVGAIALSGFLARTFFKERTERLLEQQLESALFIAAHALTPANQLEWCEVSARDTRYRVTLLKADGTVVCDSHHAVNEMENHSDRVEVSDAIGMGRGVAIRRSRTHGVDMLYFAHLSADSEQVLRFALPLSELQQMLQNFDQAIVIALLMIILLLALGEVWVAHVFVRPLRSILYRAETALRTQESGLQVSDLGRSAWGEWENLEGVMESLRRDIKEKMDTLRKEKQEQIVIMDSIYDAIVVVDPDDSIMYVNNKFQLTFARQKAESLNGKSLFEFFRDPAVLGAFSNAMKNGAKIDGIVVSLESTYETKYFSLAVAPLLRDGKTPYGVVGVFHDVTELKLAEQMRIDFVANVSHEIRTPLTSINGYANTALADIGAGEQVGAEMIEPIVRNSERMIRLVSDLLDLSALDAGIVLERVALDVNELSRKVCKSFHNTAESRSLEIILEESRVSLVADEARVEQVLTNLVENSCKYTSVGGRVSVLWSEREHEVVLEVSDNGPGIEVQHLPRLFERFYRVDKGRSRNMGGTGLGLAIVKHIMLVHGGRVSVESVVGHGTVFSCFFPKAKP